MMIYVSKNDVPELSLRQLKAVVYVNKCKNVTKAAYELNRSQTAITKAITDLESRLNRQLFDRSSTGMMPTVYGKAVAKRAQLALDELQKAGVAYSIFMKDSRPFHTIPIFSMDISYKRLAAFIALFEKKNIQCAADSLGNTKASVYSSVRQMEEWLSLKLFETEPDGVSPTAFGKVLAMHVKMAFAEIRRCLEDLVSIDGVTQGSVKVGTLPYTRTFITPKAINQVLLEHPELDVTTQEGSYEMMEAALRSGDIDFIVGAVREHEVSSDITTEILFEDKLAVIARADHPLMAQKQINLKLLQGLPWVLPAKGSPAWHLFNETLESYQMTHPKHAIHTSSLSMVRGLLIDSDRVALLSEHQIYYEKKCGLLDVLPVELPDTYRPIGVTLRKASQPSPAAKLFIDQLRLVAEQVKQQAKPEHNIQLTTPLKIPFPKDGHHITN
jgi:LysR family transcriptional regulator of gallate degradation